MSRSRWLHNLLNLARSRQDRRRLASRQRRLDRPLLEALEDRITPSPVIENAPDVATLQTDLTSATAANTQYLINLTGASSAYNLTAGQELIVSAAASGSTVSIVGTGQSITGNGNRVFNVVSGANVILQDLTITGGAVTSTSSDVQGGGIFDAGGDVTLGKVTVKANRVTAQSGFDADGGGVAVLGGGNLTIQGGSVIETNGAIDASGNNKNQGGGVYVSGASTVTLLDSTLHNNAAGDNNPDSGSAFGGGLYVGGSGWTVTLKGNTFSLNKVFGGEGTSGKKAGVDPSSKAGPGGSGGNAQGGALFATGSGSLTILNDLASPTANPSTFLDNSAQGGAGGAGGTGGAGSTAHEKGGNGGSGGLAQGGGIFIGSGSTIVTEIGNTTFYGNTVSGGTGGAGGPAGGTGGTAGTSQSGGEADGGGLALLENGAFTMVNSTVAKNTVTGGNTGGGSATQSPAAGGGILDQVTAAVTLDNNTITQNTLNGGTNTGTGIGISVATGKPTPTLVNNLIQANQSTGSSAFDLDSGGTTLSSANNNFITSISSSAVSTTTNIVGNSQTQLGGVVGVTSGGEASGGPIYYPLLAKAVSVGAGSTSVLSTIAGVEGTSTAKATDEIGHPRLSNGSIDLGAIQSVHTSPPPAPPPSPPPPPPPPPPPTLKVPPLLAFLNSLLGGVETVNANGTETITDSLSGITLFVSTFDSSGNLVSVDFFGINITFLFA